MRASIDWAKRFAAAMVMLAATSASAQHAVYIVRHAERADAPKDDPPLTDAGRVRAAVLADALANAHIGTVITTHYARSVDTGAPTATRAAAKVVRVMPMRGEAARHIEAVVAAVQKAQLDAPVLVVGHSNTVSEIANALGAMKLAPLCETSYSIMLVLTWREKGLAPSVAQLRYGTSDTLARGDCL